MNRESLPKYPHLYTHTPLVRVIIHHSMLFNITELLVLLCHVVQYNAHLYTSGLPRAYCMQWKDLQLTRLTEFSSVSGRAVAVGSKVIHHTASIVLTVQIA